MAAAAISIALRRLQTAARIEPPWLSGHSFRVGAALNLLQRGIPLEKIMLRGGWKSDSTALKYLRTWIGEDLDVY